MNFLLSIRSEFLKTRHTSAFYVTVIGAAIVPLMIFFEAYLGDGFKKEGEDPWYSFFRVGYQAMSLFALPIYIVLLSTLLAQNEYRNNTWKQVMISPQPYLHVYLSKFVNLQRYVLLFLVSYTFFLTSFALVTDFVTMEFRNSSHDLNVMDMLKVNIVALGATLGISTIQFHLSIRFRNFLVPVAIGFICWFAATMLVLEFHSPNAQYFPFSYPILTIFPKYKDNLLYYEGLSIGYAVLVLALGFVDFRFRKIKYN